jgi:hypothetical protein
MERERPAGWVGPGGLNDRTTYVTRSADDVPTLPDIRLDGTFSWLPDPGKDLDWAIGSEFDVRSVDRLEGVADTKGITLPGPLVAFLKSEKRNWVRSATGCWLDLPSDLVSVPGTDATAIRFLNDQQGAQFWYATVSPAGEELGVIASDDLFDAPEPWLDGAAAETYVCAPSYEAFLLRFWIENEIWFRTRDNEPLTDAQRRYADLTRSPR